MKRLLLPAMLLLTGILAAQTYVPPGDGTLSQAIADAFDGDVLELAPGGLYTESVAYFMGTIIDKEITIMVEGENPEKAVLQILTPPDGITSSSIFRMGNNSSLTLRHLDLDGNWFGVATTNYAVTFYLGEVPVFTTVNKLRIESCYIHHFVDWALASGNSSQRANLIVDSTLVDDVIFENVETAIYYKYCGANYISMTNSTINTTSSYGFRVAGPGESNMPLNTPDAVIDHTTWYNIGTGIKTAPSGGDDPREIIQVEKGPHLGQWTVTNSIFVNQNSKDRTAINIKDTVYPAMVHHICLWDVGGRTWSGSSHNITVSDTIAIDPEFADPDNGDFTLPAGSPLLSFAADGGAIGDLRWAGNATAVDNDMTANLPAVFALYQNHPNPFNPETTVSFSLEKAAWTSLTVYDLNGRAVMAPVSGMMPAGLHTVKLNAGDLPSGIYIYRLVGAGKTTAKKMTLLR